MEQLLVEATLPIIVTNYDVWRAQLEFTLAQYDVVIVADEIAEAKKLATELNKMAAAIGDRRKEVVASIGGPLREFETQVKELEAMCKDGRKKILDQIAAFEATTLDQLETELNKLLIEGYNKHNVSGEFRNGQTADLIKISNMTAGGKVAKAARDAVAARVGECLNRQTRCALRLSELENRSHRAGLHSPLTREHVAGFLFVDDEAIYQSNLIALIDRELERQAEIMAAAKKIQEMAAFVPERTIEVYTGTPPDLGAPGLSEGFGDGPSPELRQVVEALATPPGMMESFGYGPETGHEPPPCFVPKTPDVIIADGQHWVTVMIELRVRTPINAPMAAIEASTRKRLVTAGVEKSIHSIVATVPHLLNN
jgi:hypothetical protein